MLDLSWLFIAAGISAIINYIVYKNSAKVRNWYKEQLKDE